MSAPAAPRDPAKEATFNISQEYFGISEAFFNLKNKTDSKEAAELRKRIEKFVNSVDEFLGKFPDNRHRTNSLNKYKATVQEYSKALSKTEKKEDEKDGKDTKHVKKS